MIVRTAKRGRGDVTVIDARGNLTLGKGSKGLHARIWELVKAGSTRILIDMSGIVSIDTSGLGELVAGYMTVSNAGGEMKLLNVSRPVKHLLQMTGVCAILETYEDEPSESRSEFFFG